MKLSSRISRSQYPKTRRPSYRGIMPQASGAVHVRVSRRDGQIPAAKKPSKSNGGPREQSPAIVVSPSARHGPASQRNLACGRVRRGRLPLPVTLVPLPLTRAQSGGKCLAFMRDNWHSNRVFKSCSHILCTAASHGPCSSICLENHLHRNKRMGRSRLGLRQPNGAPPQTID